MRRVSYCCCLLVLFFVGALSENVRAEASTSDLFEQLGHDDANVRLEAVKSLGARGGTIEAKTIAPELAAAFKKESSDEVRYALALALGRMGPEAKVAVPDLAAALNDPQVRVAAARALGSVGPDAEPAIPALIALLGQERIAVEGA